MDGNDESRIIFEWRRKIFHVLLGSVFASLFYFDIMRFWIGASFVIIGLFISWIYRYIRIPVINWFLNTFERPAHIKEFPGRSVIAIFFSITLLTFFNTNIALAAILIWTFGDTAAALFGLHFGKHKYKDKTWEGLAAGLIFGTVPALLFVPIYAAFLGALAAMTLEFIEFKVWHMDDNVFIPLAAAIVMFLLLSV
jgi:dolichol kinase